MFTVRFFEELFTLESAIDMRRVVHLLLAPVLKQLSGMKFLKMHRDPSGRAIAAVHNQAYTKYR